MHELVDERLGQIVLDIGELVGAQQLLPADVCGAIASVAGDGRVLDGLVYRFDSTRYARSLLYSDPAGRFSLLTIVWQPGQSTPLHTHQTWCAVAVHTGELEETAYVLDAGAPPRWNGKRMMPAGGITHDDGLQQAAHRLTNRSASLAVSLHVYGVARDRVNDGVNVVIPAASPAAVR